MCRMLSIQSLCKILACPAEMHTTLTSCPSTAMPKGAIARRSRLCAATAQTVLSSFTQGSLRNKHASLCRQRSHHQQGLLHTSLQFSNPSKFGQPCPRSKETVPPEGRRLLFAQTDDQAGGLQKTDSPCHLGVRAMA